MRSHRDCQHRIRCVGRCYSRRHRRNSAEPDPPGLEEVEIVMDKSDSRRSSDRGRDHRKSERSRRSSEEVVELKDDAVDLRDKLRRSSEEITDLRAKLKRRSRSGRGGERDGDGRDYRDERDRRDYRNDRGYRDEREERDYRDYRNDRDRGDPSRERRYRNLSREKEELERERRRHYEERRRYEEERRRIRDERLQIERHIKDKKEQDRWLKKSDDFLRKLGIPAEPELVAAPPSPEPYRRRGSQERSHGRYDRGDRHSDERSASRHYVDDRSSSLYPDNRRYGHEPLSSRYPEDRRRSSGETEASDINRTFGERRTQTDDLVNSLLHTGNRPLFGRQLSPSPPRSRLSDEYSRFSAEINSARVRSRSPDLGVFSARGPSVGAAADLLRTAAPQEQKLGSDIDLRGGAGSRVESNPDVLKPGNYFLDKKK